MYEKEKRLPEIVRQVGRIKGSIRVYIEEYAYGYLRELKIQAENGQVRAAIFGNTFVRDGMQIYLIYGVVRMQDGELQGESFFTEHEKLGFVSLHRSKDNEKQPDGCYVFYEPNEAMQEYLLAEKQIAAGLDLQRSVTNVYKRHKRNIVRGFVRSKVLQKLFLGIMLFVTAVAASAINHYEEMREFAIIAAKAIQEIR